MILPMNLMCIMQERCSYNKNRASIAYCENGLTQTDLTPTTSLTPLSPLCSVMNQSGRRGGKVASANTDENDTLWSLRS